MHRHTVRTAVHHKTTRNPCIAAAGLVVALAALLLFGGLAVPARAQTSKASSAGGSSGFTAAGHRMFAYYYLWWSAAHWHDTLGQNYPYGAATLPLPASLDSKGCNAKSNYAGNRLTDVPAVLWTQDDAATIERDVRQALTAGLAGFAVNWVGTGSSFQTTTSNTYSKRLDTLVRVVNKVRGEGRAFSLWISYKSSAAKLSTPHMVNDLAFLASTYGKDPAFDRSNGNRPTLIMMGSRKYSTSTLALVSTSARTKFYLVGDENEQTWTPARATYLDADQYYWSSQDPFKNPESSEQLGALAQDVRSSGLNPDGSSKGWFAPLAPGYNKEIAGGTNCVPRKSGATLRALYAGNVRSNPDAWVVISWNEITEGTYLVPLERYKRQSVDTLRRIVDRS
jgi:hypothetical protein